MKEVFVVAGGASGIGAAVANKLSGRYKVFVIDVAEPENRVDDVAYIQADLTNSAEVELAVSKLPDSVYGLVSSVGVMRRGKMYDSTVDEYELLMDTNVKSAWLLIKELRPKLKDDATIVQISSGHVLEPEADPALYTLSKKAVTSLIEILKLTEPDFNIKVVYPGPVETQLLLHGRNEKDVERIKKIAVKPDEIATKIIQLVDSDKKTLKFWQKDWDYHLE